MTTEEKLRKAAKLLREAKSLRNLGYNERHAAACAGRYDETGMEPRDYRLEAEKLERRIDEAIAALVPAPPESRDTPPRQTFEDAWREYGVKAPYENGVRHVARWFWDAAVAALAAGGAAGATTAAAWVPVGERLPSDRQRVLVIEPDGYVEVASRGEYDGYFGWWSEGGHQLDGDDEPTHWQPLPVPHADAAAGADGLGTRGGRKGQGRCGQQ